jgi:hypothetical protein
MVMLSPNQSCGVIKPALSDLDLGLEVKMMSYFLTWPKHKLSQGPHRMRTMVLDRAMATQKEHLRSSSNRDMLQYSSVIVE